MKFGSVCSGIEAASVAWHPLGWRASWFAEVDRAASEVLAHRFPDVANHGDMTLLPGMVQRREIEAPDALVGGTPCQAFSIAGMRKGLSDERGQLTLAYVELADAIDRVRSDAGNEPCIIVWENVPGVLSSKDNAFGCFLAGLAGEDVPLEPPGKKWGNAGVVLGPKRAIAWRIIDAQYVGLAQRRRRVFVVASAREGFDPAAILLEFDGVRRDSAPRREKGEGVTHPTAPCLTSSGRGVARTGDTRGQDPVVAMFDDGTGRDVRLDSPAPTWLDGRDVAQTLDAVLYKGQTMPEKNRFPAVLQPICVHGTQDPCTSEHVAFALGRNNGGENVIAFFSAKDYGADATEDLSPTLRSMGHADSHANGGGQVGVAYAFQPRIARNGRGDMGELVNALKAEGFDASEDGTGRGQPIVPCGFQSSQSGIRVNETAGTLDANYGSRRHNGVLYPRMAVRRLMPVECERLQGFPDGWTDVPTGKKGKSAADGPRYKQLGNSMAVKVMHWIGQRIDTWLKLPKPGGNGGPAWTIDDMFG